MLQRIGLLAAFLFLMVFLGFSLQNQKARSSSASLPGHFSVIGVEDDLVEAFGIAQKRHPESFLLAVALDFAGELSRERLSNYYFLFGDPTGVTFIIEPLTAFRVSEVEEEILKLPYRLQSIATKLLKVWPEEVFLIAANNGGEAWLRGEGAVRTNLLLLHPQDQVAAWYLSSRAETGGLFKLVVNASSGTVIEQ